MTQYNSDVPVFEEERKNVSPFIMSEPIRLTEQAKERDQKFGIVLSPGQAKLDFDEWTKELAGSQGNIGVLFLDIDNFKSLNTAYTETKVDATILPAFMRLLNSLAMKRGGVYRYGGDEFLIVLPNHDVGDSAAYSERVCSTIASNDFKVDGGNQKLTVSASCPCNLFIVFSSQRSLDSRLEGRLFAAAC